MFRTIAATFALLVTTTAFTSSPADAADDAGKGELDQVAPLVQPSIVYETITWKGYVWDIDNTKYIGTGDDARQFVAPMQCTGFVVNPEGWIGTAGHCVDPRGGKQAVIEAAAKWAVANGWYKAGTTVESLLANQHYRVNTFDANDKLQRNTVDRTVTTAWGASVSGVEVAKSKPARVIAFQKYELGDGALLKVDESDLNAIPLADAGDVDINSNVVAVGYPAVIDGFTDPDLIPTFNPGTISSKKTVAKGLLPVLQLSASLSGGMSGGPTVDYAGEVIGVNSSRFVGEPFNYAVTAERIKELLNGSGVDNELSSTTEDYRAGIKAFFEGDKKAAVKNLAAVVDEQPANGIASDYLKKAKALPDPKAASKPDSGSSPLVWIIGGAVLLLALLGGLVALLMRRRGGSTPAPQGPVSGTPAPPAYPSGAPAAGNGNGYPGPDARPAPIPTATAPDSRESVDARAATPAGFAPTASASGPVGASMRPAEPPVTATVHQPDPTPNLTPDPTPDHKFCTECGTRSEAGVKFCGECGSKL